jgi:hypothetical protein
MVLLGTTNPLVVRLVQARSCWFHAFQLETGPSTLGLDHACVCIANGKKTLASHARPVNGWLQ